jgi:hypothetical protein
MGVGIYPVFNPPVPGAGLASDGKLLARNFEALDAIAAAAGLPTFSSFGDNRPIPAGFEGDPDELDDALGPFNEWFPAADGLRVVEGVSAAISSGAAGVQSLRSRDQVVGELRDLAACLRPAAERGARFRLELG